jgi:PAS domain-containing protein
MNAKEIFNKRQGSFLTVLGFALVILIGIIDYLTGPAFSSLVFYLIPVIFVFWFVGRSAAGILVSITSAVMWVLTDMISRPSYSHIIIPLWNVVEKLGIFFIVVYILLRLAEKEKALKFEHGQFLSILDTTDDLIYIADPESYEILYANSALSNLVGSKIIGERCYETLQSMEKPCDFCTNQYIFGENKGKPYFWEHWDRVHQRWYRRVDRAIKWPDGRWVRYETAVDISTSKKLERERKNMLSMFAHDMKNPVIIAGGFLSMKSQQWPPHPRPPKGNHSFPSHLHTACQSLWKKK